MYQDEANRQFGAWRLDDHANQSKVKFSIFFPSRAADPSQYEASRPGVADFGDPKIQSIHVTGNFQSALGGTDWTIDNSLALQPTPHPKGVVWTLTTAQTLPQGFYDYKYFVTFQNGDAHHVGDPCSRYGGADIGNENSAFVLGPQTVDTVRPLRNGRKPLRDLVMYELNLDDFSDEFRYTDSPLGQRSAIDAAIQRLDYLAHMGVNAILFLPWTAWPNNQFSWGYTPYAYFSVEHRYTNDNTDPSPHRESIQLSRLKRLISECHDRDIHVIMDGVFNHVTGDAPGFRGFPYRWFYQNPDACPYVGRFGGEFDGLKDLDYNNGCTQEFIRDVCFYWMDEFGIDGIRFDNTVNFYLSNDHRGLPQLLDDIEAHAADPAFSLTLEHLNMSAAEVTNATQATSYWNNALYGCSFDSLWSGRIDGRLMNALDSHRGLAANKVATSYLSNHDHSHVTWQAGAATNEGSMKWYRTQPYAIALFTMPGVPMIQNGQEFGEDHWIPEDDHGSSRRVQARPLRWSFFSDKFGSVLADLYRKLAAMRKNHPGLRSDNIYPSPWEEWQTEFNDQGYGVSVSRQVAIFHRWGNDGAKLERFIIVLNFSPEDRRVDVPFSVDGTWTDLLNNNQTLNVQGFFQRDYLVPSHWGAIFFRAD
jgi:1,4-alpha-glucan branching enzyme